MAIQFIVLSGFTSVGFSQPIVLTDDETIEFTQVTTIDRDAGTPGDTRKTKLKMELYDWCSAIDVAGNNLVTHSYARYENFAERTKLIKNFVHEPQIVYLPGHRGGYHPQFSSDGNTVYYVFCDQDMSCDWETQFAYYNLLYMEEFRYMYLTINLWPYRFYSYLNRNGNTALSVIENQSIYELYFQYKKGENWERTIKSPYGAIQNPLISDSGNRVFFQMKESGDAEWQWVFIDKQAEGWSVEKPVPSMTLTAFGETENVEIVKIANEGKTLILKTAQNRLAVSHENESGWSEPEFVGDYGDEANPAATLYFYPSGDGRVIAVQRVKRFDEIFINTPLVSDAFVFIQDLSGNWSRHPVNSENEDIRAQILLSGDGRKLVWIPTKKSSVGYEEEYQ